MWDIFKKKKQTNIVIPTRLKKTELRNNMWVMTPQGVGILFNLQPESSLVHLTNDKGETTKDIFVITKDLRQAKWLEIPEPRRGVDREQGYHLGYE